MPRTTATLIWPVMHPYDIPDGHCTIMFLGEAEEIGLGPEEILSSVSETQAPGLVGVTSYEVFGDDDDQVWVALLDDEQLFDLRERIAIELYRLGVESKSDYEDYRPHVTLAPYESEDQELPDVPFVALGVPRLWWAGEIYTLGLETS